MNIAPGAGSIHRPVDQHSNAVSLYHGHPAWAEKSLWCFSLKFLMFVFFLFYQLKKIQIWFIGISSNWNERCFRPRFCTCKVGPKTTWANEVLIGRFCRGNTEIKTNCILAKGRLRLMFVWPLWPLPFDLQRRPGECRTECPDYGVPWRKPAVGPTPDLP